MDLAQIFGSDGALVLFSAAGLVATTFAILQDTKAQRSGLAGQRVRVDR